MAGCNNQNDSKCFLSLEEAYYNGYLSRSNLLNIAYYYNGKKNINDSEFEPQAISKNDLDEATVQNIKETHLKRVKKEYNVPTATIDTIKISGYFGIYKDSVVVIMSCSILKFDLSFEDEHVIDDIRFLNYRSKYPGGIEVWRE